MVINFRKVASRVEFRLVFRAPSWKFKILANPNVLDHGMSYEHGFVENTTVINFTRSCMHCRVSIGFTCTVLEIQNTGHSRRLTMIRVAIGFSCTVSKI
ncbi:hypothetical protein BHM03_00063117 [Ensete ventricosum]|nr:hypothetical protein BHM03_00063117 [Ensete ventricosum]